MLNKLVKTKDLYASQPDYLVELFESCEYPWEMLPKLKNYIQALIEKVCSSDTLMRNLNDLVKVALDCTESNISVSEALKYVKYVKDLDPAKITSDTVPYLGDPGRYVELDEDGIKDLVNERIYGIAPKNSTENQQEENQFNESNQLNEEV